MLDSGVYEVFHQLLKIFVALRFPHLFLLARGNIGLYVIGH